MVDEGQAGPPPPDQRIVLINNRPAPVPQIEGSTSLWESLPMAVMAQCVEMHNAAIRTASARHAGWVGSLPGFALAGKRPTTTPPASAHGRTTDACASLTYHSLINCSL